MKSNRIKINTNKGEHHKAIPPEKIAAIRAGLSELPEMERHLLSLLSYTGMRIEEVLGLQWGDIDFEKKEIHVVRAVVHPKRNQPEIKLPKTASSMRSIPLTEKLKELLTPHEANYFVVSGEQPLTYTRYKKMFDRLKDQFNISEYSAHDFRDTCATEWREAGMALDGVSKLLGHANTAVTENCYVKFREKSLEEAGIIMNKL